MVGCVSAMTLSLRGLGRRGQAGLSRIGTRGMVAGNGGLKEAAVSGYQPHMTALRSFAAFAVTLAAMAMLSAIFASDAAMAQDREPPYWATMRFDEVNMRVGPSQEYPIEWVYKRAGLPVKVVRLREGWRLIQDHDGTQGWIAASQLRRSRGALIIGDGLAAMREAPTTQSPLRWNAEPGVVGELMRCRDNFCEIDVAGRAGWVAQERLWGAGEIEPAP